MWRPPFFICCFQSWLSRWLSPSTVAREEGHGSARESIPSGSFGAPSSCGIAMGLVRPLSRLLRSQAMRRQNTDWTSLFLLRSRVVQRVLCECGPDMPAIHFLMPLAERLGRQPRLSRAGDSSRDWSCIQTSPPNTSNQAMERTATRRAFSFRVACALLLRSTRTLGGRRSSFSR
jgi:hypothetical protein